MFSSDIKRYCGLLFSLVQRDLIARFRQSTLGFSWLILQPLCMLLVYSFVFQTVIQVRWHDAGFKSDDIPVGLILFAGISAHMLLAETLTRCPAIISSNASYVKKIVFPLSILPMTVVFSALVFTSIAFFLIFSANIFLTNQFSIRSVAIVIPVISLTCMALGLGWLTAALGVYLRDINQLMPFINTIALFTAPICYPRDIVPEKFQLLMTINPLTIPVEAIRVLVFGGDIDHHALIGYSIAAIVMLVVGLVVFRRLKIGFADVL